MKAVTRESLLSLNPEEVRSLSEYFAFCKYYFKPKFEEKVEGYLYKRDKQFIAIDKNKFGRLLQDFPFLKELENDSSKKELFQYLKKHKSEDTFKDFPLSWLKDKILKKKLFKLSKDKDLVKVSNISGIFEEDRNLQENLKNYVRNLPKYSFSIWFKFKLEAPYFSKDDDELYIIQNPVLKETNFKVPMVRGSGWKGALAHAFREIINEESIIGKKQKVIESFLRIFGAGSEIIKIIEEYIKKKTSNPDKLANALIEFILFELGLGVSSEDLKDKNSDENQHNLLKLLKEKIEEKKRNLNPMLPSEFQSHKGRAIFYPTFFDSLSLEVINPHDRRKRAGTQPIYYEVVPKGAEGIFQLVYIPFDGILKPESELKKEVEEDLNNLITAIKKLQDLGIGAKTKLGWGRFSIKDSGFPCCIINFEPDSEVRQRCRVINVYN